MPSGPRPELRLPDPPLADDVIALRPWREADIRAAHRATQDPLISRFTLVPRAQSEEDVRRFVEGREPARRAGEMLSFAIADARSDAFLGTVSLLRFVRRDRRCEVGYWVAPWARGRGVATRAVGMLSRWGLRELGLERIGLHTDVDNPASRVVAHRCGFTREAVLRSFLERDGRRYDIVVFSLLADDVR